MAYIQIQDLTYTYPGKTAPALEKVNLSIGRGEYVVLCGKSGSGKTTLLRHLKPVLTPYGRSSGGVFLEGQAIETLSPYDQARRIGFVMQSPDDQIVTDQVWHELAFGLESLGVDRRTMRLRVAEMASFFGIQSWFHREVSQLSGGQKQLLNLASIMAMQPEVLILDEPTSQLDPIAASDFLNTVRKINLELGTTVLITEHRLEDIFPHADRVVVMEEGHIAANADPRQVGAQLWRERSQLIAALPTPTRVFLEAGGEGPCPLTVREGRNWLIKSFRDAPPQVTERPPEPERPQSAPVLSVEDAWFRYEKDGPDVLRGVDLTVPEGCLYAIVGGNGAGKSTLLKTVCGICQPYRGKITLFGKKLKSYRGQELYRGVVGMLPQDPKSLFVGSTLQEDLDEMGAEASARERVARLCRIDALLGQHPYDLSGGEQQRAALAKVLLTRPKLLLLDEPTKGLDSFFKGQLAAVLRELIQEKVTVVMVSHDIEFCAEHADRVSMFFDGQILTTDTPRRFFGQNSFYTTAANRMSRCVFHNAVTARDVAELYRANGGRGQ